MIFVIAVVGVVNGSLQNISRGFRLGLSICWVSMSLAVVSAAAVADQGPSPAGSMAEFCRHLPRQIYTDLPRVTVPDDWFEAYRIAAGVTAIYEPHQWQEVISYLIEGDERALLFDSGNGISDITVVVRALTQKPVTVLNSHGHFDHVGGNFAFDHVLGMDTGFSRQRQHGIPNKEIASEVSAAALCRDLPPGVAAQNHSGRPYKITSFIKDGAIIELGNRRLEVIHVPGHTPDAIALIDRQAGLMWTGDSYYSGPIWLYAPETDLAAYEQSINRLISEIPNVKALLPAHNTPRVDPKVLIRLRDGFRAMLAGRAKRTQSWEGTVIYKIDGESEFSFLMRDEALPYD